MNIHFWGTRGSLPATVTSEQIEKKIFLALQKSKGKDFANDDAIKKFIAEDLSFDIRGSYGCNTSCVEIRAGGEPMICDAGSGLRDFGNYCMQAGMGTNQTFHIFMSHLHWDHIHGFPFFVPSFIKGNNIHIYGFHKGIEEAFVNQQVPPFFPLPLEFMAANIEFHELDIEKEYEINGCKVKGYKQNHPGDSYGYSFEKGGKKFVYSTDSEHLEDADKDDYPFLDFIRNADLMVFDAQYNLMDHFHVKSSWGHSSNLVGVELSSRAQVKHLCLFHNEHTLADDKLEKFQQDSRRYATIYDENADLQVSLSYDGLEIAL